MIYSLTHTNACNYSWDAQSIIKKHDYLQNIVKTCFQSNQSPFIKRLWTYIYRFGEDYSQSEKEKRVWYVCLSDSQFQLNMYLFIRNKNCIRHLVFVKKRKLLYTTHTKIQILCYIMFYIWICSNTFE